MVFAFEDERGDVVNLEFLGLVLMNEARYGFFYPVDDEHPALGSGEVVLLEVTSLDDEGQPDSFEVVADEAVAAAAYEAFRQAASGLYDFE